MWCDMKACTHTHTHTQTNTDSQGKYNLNQCFQTVINEPILKCVHDNIFCF